MLNIHLIQTTNLIIEQKIVDFFVYDTISFNQQQNTREKLNQVLTLGLKYECGQVPNLFPFLCVFYNRKVDQ